MYGIGGLSSLSSGQLNAIRRIHELSTAIADNTKRLTTLKRINAAKDDPSGLIQAEILERELNAAQTASQSVTRANALLSTADAAASEILTGLNDARALILEAAGGTLSDSEIAANQIQVDTILNNINSLAQTEFAGKRLLDGSSGYRVTGYDTGEVREVDVLDKRTASDVTVDINVTTQAAQATDSYTGGALSEDITLVVTGPDGSTTVSLEDGDDTQTIADAFNAVTHLTGITATRIDASQVDFNTADYGSAAVIQIDATEGTFTTTSGNTAAGTDAVATINGQDFTAAGTTFNVNTSELSALITIDPSANGSLTSFSVEGEGLEFVVGTSVTDTARIGLPALTTARLGGVSGTLHSIISGGANTLTSGNSATALSIIDDAIADVTRSQARIGGFQRFTLDTSDRLLASVVEHTASALSSVQDADVAVETALLSQNQLLKQTAFEALSITTLQSSDVLSLLRGVT